MLNDYIKKLSKLLHSPILTPYNLLENLELENYLSINYFKENDCVLADIKFLAHNEEVTFRYTFDNESFLQTIYHMDGDDMVIQFDRRIEADKLKDEVKKSNCLKECI